MGYFIRPNFLPAAAAAAATPASLERDQKLLLHGDSAERRAALARLVAVRAEPELTACLVAEDSEVAQLAAAGLWEVWVDEAGPEARGRMEEGVEIMGSGDFERAATVFDGLARAYPSWAEALNKLATVRYLQGRHAESITFCRQVLARKPDHFGAWNGLALCAIQTEDWGLALEAVRECLRLQPASVYNRQLLKLVESRLTEA